MSHSINGYFKHGHGESPVVAATAEDVDALIDAMLAEPFRNSVAALYVNERPRSERGRPDHELRVAIHGEAKVGGLRYSGIHNDVPGVWYVKGQKSERDEVFYYYMGHDEGWPDGSEITLDEIRAGVKAFLAGGGERPATGQWTEWEEGLG